MLALSFALGLALLLGRDLPDTPLRALVVVASGWAVLLLPFAAAATLASRLKPTRGQLFAWLTLATIFLMPPVFAGVRLGRAAFESYRFFLPLYLVAGLVASVGGAWLLRRLDEVERPWPAALVVALMSMGPFVNMHLGEGTFTHMRIGRDLAHHQLFIGTWGTSGLIALLLAAAFLWSELGPRRRAALAALGLVLGLGLLEADRRMFVGLHDAVHLWLELAAVLALVAALTLYLPRWLRADLVGLGAFALLGVFQFVGPVLDIDDPARAVIADAPYGPVVLKLQDKLHPQEEAPGSELAVAYDQHLDDEVPPQWRNLNIVLISVDTLRWDALEHMRHTRELLVDRGASFTRAYAPSTRTSLSMGALLAGRTVGRVHWRLVVGSARKLIGERRRLDPRTIASLPRVWHTTIPEVEKGALLAERLSAAGYRTLAMPFLGHAEFFKPGFGYDLGFQVYPDLAGSVLKPPTSRKIAKQALEQLDDVEQPFFHWIHLFDPHEARKTHRYPVMLRATDKGIKVYLEGLADRGLADNTAVFLVADHGEAFGEHPHTFHATHLWDEQTRVPMLAFLPGMKPLRFDRPASVIDATATIAALAGADTSTLDGVNLLPLLDDGETYPADRPVFTEFHRWRGENGEKSRDMQGIVRWPHKLIHDRMTRTRQLFNLEVDPGETANVAVKKEAAAFKELSEMLNWYARTVEAEYPLPDYAPSSKP